MSEAAPPLRGRIIFYFAIMAFALFISLFKSPHIVQDVILYKTLVFYACLYFLFFRAAQDIKTVRYLIVCVAFTYGMMTLEMIREAAAFGFAPKIRLVGAFGMETGNPNYAGAYFAVLIPVFATFMMYYKDDKRVKLIATGLFFMGMMSAFYTESRQAYAAILITTLLLAVRKSMMYSVIIVIAVLNFALWAPESVVERVEGTSEVNEETGEEVLEDSAESRFVIWGAAWNLIKSNPIGIGYNQFKLAIDPYMPAWITARDAHSSYFLIWTEAGWIGLIAFLSLLYGFYAVGSRLYRAGTETKNNEAILLGLGFSMSAIAVALSNVTSSTFQSGEVMANYWIMAALISRYAILIEEGYRVNDEREETSDDESGNVLGVNHRLDQLRRDKATVRRFNDSA
ncbi:MAG: O-antigen ligase family protein [Pseudomonadota bacterium]